MRRRSILTEGNGIQRRGCVSFLRCKNKWCDSSFQKYGYNIVFERKLGGPNCNYIYSDLTECTELTEVNGRGCISILRSKDKGCELSFSNYKYSIVFERYLRGAICNYLLYYTKFLTYESRACTFILSTSVSHTKFLISSYISTPSSSCRWQGCSVSESVVRLCYNSVVRLYCPSRRKSSLFGKSNLNPR